MNKIAEFYRIIYRLNYKFKVFGSKESDSANPENKKLPSLDFDGKKYDINLLPDEVKDLSLIHI